MLYSSGDMSFDFLLSLELLIVVITAFGVFVEAPYGKHGSNLLGNVQLSPRFGWWLMELPATVCFLFTWYITPPKVPLITSCIFAFI